MIDLTTRYMGITLRNPIIVGSSGLTSTVDSLMQLEQNGAGAVVLKSVFEEEILMEHNEMLSTVDQYESNLEYLDYYDYKLKANTLDRYTQLIENAKKRVTIPVIASVNCLNGAEWVSFARRLQDAGADALELNIFVLPSNAEWTSAQIEDRYLQIVQKVLQTVKIPVVLKMSPYFTNLLGMITRLSKTGLSGLVLFNRYYSPDIDIVNRRITATNVLSHPEDFAFTLRWIAIASSRVQCDLCAATGIHDGNTIVKQLLAGANAVQMVSSLYRKGASQIETSLQQIERWMSDNRYTSIDQFIGKLNQAHAQNPAEFERVQFMRYFKDAELGS